MKVSANVKIAMQCFENFGGANAPNAPPGCAPGLSVSCWPPVLPDGCDL